MRASGFRSGKRDKPDTTFPKLSRREAEEIRTLATQSLEGQGVVVTRVGDQFVIGGKAYGDLRDLLAFCFAMRGEVPWQDIVEYEMATVAELMSQNPRQGPSDEEVLADTYLRLLNRQQLLGNPHHTGSSVVPAFGDVVQVFAVDRPRTVEFLKDDVVDRIGSARLTEVGLANLTALPIEHVRTLEVLPGTDFQTVVGNSFMTASKALVLPHTLEQVFGPRSYPNGVLVVVPCRGQLGLFPVDSSNAIQVAEYLIDVVPRALPALDGPISQHVFWWRGGSFAQLSGPRGMPSAGPAWEEFRSAARSRSSVPATTTRARNGV